jgi:hypothetical protein
MIYGLVQNVGPYSTKKRQSYQADNTEFISPRYPFTPDYSGAVHQQSDWSQRRVQDKDFINPRQKLQKEAYLENLVQLSNLMTNSFAVPKTVATQTQTRVADGGTQTQQSVADGETQTQQSVAQGETQTQQSVEEDGTQTEKNEDSGYESSMYSDSVVEAAELPMTQTADRLFGDKHTNEPETITDTASQSYKKKFVYRGVGITGDLPPRRAPNYLGIKTTSLLNQARKIDEDEDLTPTNPKKQKYEEEDNLTPTNPK